MPRTATATATVTVRVTRTATATPRPTRCTASRSAPTPPRRSWPTSPRRASTVPTRAPAAHPAGGVGADVSGGGEHGPAPGPRRRYRFKHPTASGKTIAAAGFVEAARTEGVLILTHRRLLVDQFRRELKDHGYGTRITEIILGDSKSRKGNPIT